MKTVLLSWALMFGVWFVGLGIKHEGYWALAYYAAGNVLLAQFAYHATKGRTR